MHLTLNRLKPSQLIQLREQLFNSPLGFCRLLLFFNWLGRYGGSYRLLRCGRGLKRSCAGCLELGGGCDRGVAYYSHGGFA